MHVSVASEPRPAPALAGVDALWAKWIYYAVLSHGDCTMQPGFGFDGIAQLSDEKSRAITAENPHGEVGAGGREASALGPSRKGRPCLRGLGSGETATLMDVDGPGVIRHVWMTLTDETSADPHVLRDVVVRMYWDGEDEPSVEAPIGDFFCCGHAERCDVNSLPVVVAPDGGFNCYWPMPFRENARVTVENQHPEPIPALFYQFDYAVDAALDDETAYFHAQWRRENPTTATEDYAILDGVEGRGHYVGTFLALTALSSGWWGEGEVKCYVDGDDEYPTICGTGLEDYVGGAWGFAREDADGEARPQTFSTPFLGYHAYDPGWDAREGRPPRHGMYRWHVPDPVRFEEDLRVSVQQIGNRRGLVERSDDVSSVAYWYQAEPHAPFPDLPDREARLPR